ncbi:hypothetical protein [Streptomyces cyaneofuscatus]|uniref:hypothetical protein n=1 Tax=Streptomyces cyaneofuscatus TaxID=66883 RepID=UPI00332B3289
MLVDVRPGHLVKDKDLVKFAAAERAAAAAEWRCLVVTGGAVTWPVARAHAVHLLWHRRLAVDLAQPLGDSAWIYPAPEEPRPAYDPAHTTLTGRRRAKAAELGLYRQEAKHLGLEWFSERTLERMAAQYAEHGLMGLADGRWTPPLRGRRAVTEEVAEAIRAVPAERPHHSRMSTKTKERIIHQYLAENFDVEVHVPHYTTPANVAVGRHVGADRLHRSRSLGSPS